MHGPTNRTRRRWAILAVPRAIRVATVLHLEPGLPGSRPPRPPKLAAVACAALVNGTGFDGRALVTVAAAAVAHPEARFASLRPPAAGRRKDGRRTR